MAAFTQLSKARFSPRLRTISEALREATLSKETCIFKEWKNPPEAERVLLLLPNSYSDWLCTHLAKCVPVNYKKGKLHCSTGAILNTNSDREKSTTPRVRGDTSQVKRISWEGRLYSGERRARDQKRVTSWSLFPFPTPVLRTAKISVFSFMIISYFKWDNIYSPQRAEKVCMRACVRK